jgi:DNA replication protein DnaC
MMNEYDNEAFFHSDITPDPRDPVGQGALYRAGIGREYWNAGIAGIPDHCAYKAKLKALVDNLHIDHKEGRGAIFCGEQGFGKTAASTILLKAAIARGGQGFLCYVKNLELAFEKPWVYLTPEGVPIWDMATRGHFFVLDDLGAEIQAAGYKAGNTQAIESLIRARHNSRLPTYITTNLPLSKLAEVYGSFKTILLDKKRFDFVHVSGHNWRLDEGVE